MTTLPPDPNDRDDRYRKSRFNRFIHGMRSAGVVLGEDYGELEELNADLKEEYQPAGPDEEYWFHQILMIWWRQRRFAHLDAQIFTSVSPQQPDCDILLDKRLNSLDRYRTAMNREMQRATRELDRVQKLRGFNRHTQNANGEAQPQPASTPSQKSSPPNEPLLGAEFFAKTQQPAATSQNGPVGNSLNPDADKAA